jgi:hypothetical protein
MTAAPRPELGGTDAVGVFSPDMKDAEALQQCEKLRNLINRGPGKDPHALSEALSIVNSLRGNAAGYPRSRLAEIPDQLSRWFSVREWREDSDPAGLRVRYRLMEDITLVEKTWRPADAPGAARDHGSV